MEFDRWFLFLWNQTRRTDNSSLTWMYQTFMNYLSESLKWEWNINLKSENEQRILKKWKKVRMVKKINKMEILQTCSYRSLFGRKEKEMDHQRQSITTPQSEETTWRNKTNPTHNERRKERCLGLLAHSIPYHFNKSIKYSI